MHKLFTLFCGCALASSAAAQITTTPEGKLYDNLYRSTEAWVEGWVGTKEGKTEGIVGKVVEATDGSLYILNPISSQTTNSWAKLDKVAEGKYMMNLPQVINTETDEDGKTTYSIHRMKKSGSTYVIDEANDKVAYTWDGKTLTMVGEGSSQVILGETDQNGAWTKRGDWAQTLTTIDDKMTAPTAAATIKSYQITYNGSTIAKTEVAFEGEQAFVKLIPGKATFANRWVQLVKEGDTYVFNGPQYLGTSKDDDFKSYSSDNNTYHTYAIVKGETAPKLVFAFDAATNTFTAKGRIAIFHSKNADNTDLQRLTLSNITLAPSSQELAKPMQPTLFYCSAQTFDEENYETTFAFDLQAKDINGNALDPEKLYYNIFINDSETPYTFDNLEYRYLTEPITDIPFNFQDKQNFDIKKKGEHNFIKLYGDNEENIISRVAVQLVYKDGETVLKSDKLEANVKNAPTGIANTTLNANAKHIFTLGGKKAQALQPGVNLVKMSNGTVKKVIKQ